MKGGMKSWTITKKFNIAQKGKDLGGKKSCKELTPPTESASIFLSFISFILCVILSLVACTFSYLLVWGNKCNIRSSQSNTWFIGSYDIKLIFFNKKHIFYYINLLVGSSHVVYI